MRRMLKPALVLLAMVLSLPACANVVSNGTFDVDATGWTKWAAGWSNTGVLSSTADAAAAYTGAKGLKLQINGFSSCGVYQQVAVTPGVAYKLEGMWKSPASNSNQWFEIILLDGAFDVFSADDPSVVYNNVVAGYDSAFNPTPASFGWEAFAATYDEVPHIVDGTRVASGSVMTVVLKLGGSNSMAYFDDVTLTAVPEPTGMLALCAGLGSLGLLRRRR